MAPTTDLCTARQVAEIYGTSADTVRRWVREGKLAAIKLPSGRIRFRRTDVEALLAGDAA